MAAWTLPVRAQTWQALPFPSDSSWPGPFGQPAVITNNEIILDGQPARTIETFSGPITMDCDVSLDARTTTDGAFWLFFIPTGVALDKTATNSIFFQLGFENFGQDVMGVFKRQGIPQNPPDTALFSMPYTLNTGTAYHVTLGVAGNGALSLSVNGQPYSLSNAAVLPFNQFQVQIAGWQPDAIWHVTDFTAVSGPAFSFTNVVQTCKSKTKFDEKTMTTNVTTTCTVNISVMASNTGMENTSAFPVLLWAEQGSVFDADVGPLPLVRKVKALKPGKSVTIRQKAVFTNDQAGTFFHLTDTNLNVLASVPIE